MKFVSAIVLGFLSITSYASDNEAPYGDGFSLFGEANVSGGGFEGGIMISDEAGEALFRLLQVESKPDLLSCNTPEGRIDVKQEVKIGEDYTCFKMLEKCGPIFYPSEYYCSIGSVVDFSKGSFVK